MSTRTLEIWHAKNHDDFTVTKISLPPHQSAKDWTEATLKHGGFWTGNNFVPFHRINYIKVEYDD